jgi:serine/threonine protein kinase
MHEHNVYHGKLHGENVLIRTIDNEEKLYLVDYAYSNLCTRDAITLLVNASPSFCGKEHIKKDEKSICFFFVAPEILRGEPFSASSDMWQLGILIFFW